MIDALQGRIDRFGRAHPGLALAATLLAALATTVLLLLCAQQTILYEAF
jgi:hypothetical protein